MNKKWIIGENVIDEDGNTGVVAIVWNDGDICTIENDAAHPNPLSLEQPPAPITCPECGEPDPVLQCEKCGNTFNLED